MKLRVIPSFQPSGVSGGIERLKISHFEADKTVLKKLNCLKLIMKRDRKSSEKPGGGIDKCYCAH